jgi:hypothetical protein
MMPCKDCCKGDSMHVDFDTAARGPQLQASG